ncbi:MAG: tetratricopeptide repeat protein [Pseudomonadota bacterium]|nr:tetratricopeptide repeat protein [Pseudomonadota bacterium]
MADIFDEVEEDYRAERVRRLLTRYAGVIIAAAILLVAVIAGWRIWEGQQVRQDAAAGTLYLAALNQSQAAGPAGAPIRAEAMGEMRKLAVSAPAGYRALARLNAAAMLARDGKLPQALGLWNELAADGSVDPLLRELATLLWTQHQIDTGDPQILESRLKPLAALDSVWHPIAQQQLALLAIRQNKTAAAKDTLRLLSHDATAPDGVRNSATLLLQQLGS